MKACNEALAPMNHTNKAFAYPKVRFFIRAISSKSPSASEYIIADQETVNLRIEESVGYKRAGTKHTGYGRRARNGDVCCGSTRRSAASDRAVCRWEDYRPLD